MFAFWTVWVLAFDRMSLDSFVGSRSYHLLSHGCLGEWTLFVPSAEHKSFRVPVSCTFFKIWCESLLVLSLESCPTCFPVQRTYVLTIRVTTTCFSSHASFGMHIQLTCSPPQHQCYRPHHYFWQRFSSFRLMWNDAQRLLTR